MSARTVLGQSDITRALTRIAHEILEANHGGADLVLLGIPTRGVHLAERIGRILADIEPDWSSARGGVGSDRVGALDVTMHRDDLGRGMGRAPHQTVIPAGGIDDKIVVLVDDVLFSGRTVRAALDAIQSVGRPRAVRLAVLVDRGHRELPIRADHVGKNLPTAADERISVHLVESDGTDDVVIENGAIDADRSAAGAAR